MHHNKKLNRTPFIVGGYLAAGLVAAFCVAVTAGSAAAEEPAAKPHRADICAKLRCSADQADPVRSVFKQMHTDLNADHQALRQLRRQWAAEYAKPELDEKELERIRGQIQRTMAAIRERQHDALMELHPLLTAEQRKQVVRFLGRKGKGHHGARRRHGSRPGHRASKDK